MSDLDWAIIMEETQEAVCAFAKAEISSLVRQAIDRFQSLDPSSTYSDHKFQSFWDEYCFEVQNGLHEQIAKLRQDVLARTITDLVQKLSRETAALLTIYAAGPLPETIGSEVVGTVWKGGIEQLIAEQVADHAAYGDHYRSRAN